MLIVPQSLGCCVAAITHKVLKRVPVTQNTSLIVAIVVVFIIPEDFVNRLASDGCPKALMPDHCDYKFHEVC